MRYYSSTASEKTLSSAVSSTDTEIGLNSTTGLPASYPFTLVLNPDTASEEIVLVTGAGATKTYAVTRGSDTYQGVAGGNGTSKTTHASGDKVKHMVTARDLQEPQTHMAASSGVHGVTGSVVGTTDTQTLTNKTISSSNNTLTVSQSSVTGLVADLAAKAPLASPTFTGTPAAPTATTGTNTTQVATTAFVQTEIAGKAPLANPVFTTGISFEGATADANETLLTVAEPTADRTITLPDKTGTVALTSDVPTLIYASVYNNPSVISADGVLSFGSELFDSAGAFASNKYTATTAGKYMLSCSINILAGTENGTFNAYFRKNGSSGISPTMSAYLPTASTSRQTISLNSMVTLNGSTDYVEVYLDIPTVVTTGPTVSASWNIVYVGA